MILSLFKMSYSVTNRTEVCAGMQSVALKQTIFFNVNMQQLINVFVLSDKTKHGLNARVMH